MTTEGVWRSTNGVLWRQKGYYVDEWSSYDRDVVRLAAMKSGRNIDGRTSTDEAATPNWPGTNEQTDGRRAGNVLQGWAGGRAARSVELSSSQQPAEVVDVVGVRGNARREYYSFMIAAEGWSCRVLSESYWTERDPDVVARFTDTTQRSPSGLKMINSLWWMRKDNRMITICGCVRNGASMVQSARNLGLLWVFVNFVVVGGGGGGGSGSSQFVYDSWNCDNVLSSQTIWIETPTPSLSDRSSHVVEIHIRDNVQVRTRFN